MTLSVMMVRPWTPAHEEAEKMLEYTIGSLPS
jgi:hypothetical protein